jgi:phosphatidylglycerophosphate synthase
VPAVRIGPLMGMVMQVVLLMTLAIVTGLGAAGWVTGLTYGLSLAVALSYGLGRERIPALRPADWVTLVRATLVGCVAALTADSFRTAPPLRLLVAITIAALVLDAVDGKVARWTGLSTKLGAIFDQEIDAFLLFVLSVYVARSLGAWVLAIGVMRYAFLAAGWVLTWLRGPLPSSLWGKTVAAVQGIVLLVAMADVLPRSVAVTTVALSLAVLLQSFGHSVIWLWRHRGADLPVLASPRPAVARSERWSGPRPERVRS